MYNGIRRITSRGISEEMELRSLKPNMYNMAITSKSNNDIGIATNDGAKIRTAKNRSTYSPDIILNILGK